MTVATGIDQELIDEIVRRVLTVAKPDRIILLDSAATEQAMPERDVDLLIVESDPGDPRRESVRIADALRGLGFPIDVIVMTSERFEATKDVAGGIAYYVGRDGRTLLRPEEETRELVLKWFAKAEEDFGVSQNVLPGNAPFLGAIAFHAEQCAEKYLKAFLLRHGIDPPETMNIGYLLDLVTGVDEALSDSLSSATALNPYGVEFDYPIDFPDMSPALAKEALELASKVRDAVRAALRDHLGEEAS